MMANAVDESCERSLAGFERTELQAAARFVPGCSGKVPPGEPASAYAGATETNRKPMATSDETVKRFILILPKKPAFATEATRTQASYNTARRVRQMRRRQARRSCRDRQGRPDECGGKGGIRTAEVPTDEASTEAALRAQVTLISNASGSYTFRKYGAGGADLAQRGPGLIDQGAISPRMAFASGAGEEVGTPVSTA